MKRTINIAGLCLALAAIAIQPVLAAPARVLSKATIDRFMKDFPAITAEFEALGDGVAETLGRSDDGETAAFSMATLKSSIESVFADARVKTILAKYGWNSQFIEVYVTVMSAYMYVVFEDFYAAYPMPETKRYMDEVRLALHPDDLAIVKANRAGLEKALGMED
ncbi:MAG: hypothetical protein CVV51_07690 [Spirochaetae bacterium HGW-Spirochaetae-7]|jgi:hypothetical protein|nr:MAG: hypothetical protein CVV51_07690 [Spirochaetae bacterium HGW-Spirochaetae-7]